MSSMSVGAARNGGGKMGCPVWDDGPHEDHYCDVCENEEKEIDDIKSPCFICFYGTTAEDCRFQEK